MYGLYVIATRCFPALCVRSDAQCNKVSHIHTHTHRAMSVCVCSSVCLCLLMCVWKKGGEANLYPFPLMSRYKQMEAQMERKKRLARLLEFLPTSVSRLQAKNAKLTALELRTHTYTPIVTQYTNNEIHLHSTRQNVKEEKRQQARKTEIAVAPNARTMRYQKWSNGRTLRGTDSGARGTKRTAKCSFFILFPVSPGLTASLLTAPKSHPNASTKLSGVT